MATPRIQLSGVHLTYLSSGYKEDSFKSFVFKLLTGKKRPSRRDIHALRGIDLTIEHGERVALLGHNGAGKTSLLKAIAGIYPLAGGTIAVTGRVRALFELSLGFEHEATGRENILYRGLLLGQTPREMRALEAAVVEFADLGELIDYPIKTYSSGMLVRLAFAISTAIPGEILLLDEVIGAGDAGFRERARLRIRDLIAGSEVMVLASHDLASVRELCTRALVLNHGEILFDGPVEQAIDAYLTSMNVAA